MVASMSDQTTTNDQAVSNTESVVHTPSTDSIVAPSPRGGGKGLTITALLASLIALGGAGFTIYQGQLKDQSQSNKILVGVNSIGSDVKVLAERIVQLQREQQQLASASVTKEVLQTRLLEAENQSDLAFRDLRDEQSTIRDAFAKVAKRTERSADKLAVEEVSQLLKLANNSAVFANDKKGAINALRLADSQLKQLADPRFSVVRRTINEEIASLEAVASADITTLTSDINLLAKRISQLPLENEPQVVGEFALAEPSQSSPISAGSELKKMWLEALDVVKIKRIDQPPKPLLAPEQRYFLDQNIILKLSTAELAVLQSRPDIYQRSLESAVAWLEDYYDPRDKNVRDVIDTLHQLKRQSIGNELPPVVKSYDALQGIKGGN